MTVKYQYTGVCVDDEKMIIQRFEATSGPQASAVCELILGLWNHYIVMAGYHLLLDENVEVKKPEEFVKMCLDYYHSACRWLANEDNKNKSKELTEEKTRYRDVLRQYLSDLGELVELDSAGLEIPPLVMKALESAAGLNDLPNLPQGCASDFYPRGDMGEPVMMDAEDQRFYQAHGWSSKLPGSRLGYPPDNKVKP